MKVSPWRALLMQNHAVIWCPIHLMPYQAQWPLGGPSASVYLVDAAAAKLGRPDSYQMMADLLAYAPLCCWIDVTDLNGIYERTVPK